MKQITRFVALLMALAARAPTSSSRALRAVDAEALIVHFQYGSTDRGRLHELEQRLRTLLARTNAGAYVGHEIAIDGRFGTLTFHTTDAERLYDTVTPVFQATPFMQGAKGTLRFGPPRVGVPQRIVTIWA